MVLQSSLDWICHFQFEDESLVSLKDRVLEGYARQGILDLVGFLDLMIWSIVCSKS